MILALHRPEHQPAGAQHPPQLRHATASMPLVLGVAALCYVSVSVASGTLCAAEQQPPAVQSPDAHPTATVDDTAQLPAGLPVPVLIDMARHEKLQNHFVRARELYEWALTREPGNEAANTELAQLQQLISGAPKEPFIENDQALRRDVALAEARMTIDHADLLAHAGHRDEAASVLGTVRISLEPYHTDSVVQAQIQRVDTLIKDFQRQAQIDANTQSHTKRDTDPETARIRVRAEEELEGTIFSERLARIHTIEAHHFYEQALGLCRRLVSDYPNEPRAEATFSRLLKEAHAQRHLDTEERSAALYQEIDERLERAMIPTGFDGKVIFPDDWNIRSHRGGAYEGPASLSDWEAHMRAILAVRVSFNFNGMPAVDAIKSLVHKTNVNLIMDTSITNGEQLITIKADSMTLENALTWICQLMDTRWRVTENAIYIGGKDDVTPVMGTYDISDMLFQAKDFLPKRLGFAGAGGATQAGQKGQVLGVFTAPTGGDNIAAITPEDLVDHIQKAISPETWTQPEYGIAIHETLLIVTAPTRIHQLIKEYLRRESNNKNIMIEVVTRFLTIDDEFLEEIGVDWTTATGTNNGLLSYTNTNSTDGFIRNTSTFSHTGSINNSLPPATVPPNPVTAGTGLNLSATIIKATQLAAIVHAVEREHFERVLVEPSVITVNGVRANTFIGQQLAYIGGYTGAGTAGVGLGSQLQMTINTLALGAQLDVKPWASSDLKYVTMDLRPSLVTLTAFNQTNLLVPQFIPTGFNQNLGGGVGGATGQTQINSLILETPQTLTQSMESRVTIPDGGSLLVGGFANTADQFMTAGVPFLSHIPYVGRIFGERGRYSNRTKLFMMTTVHIINYHELEAKQ